MFVPGRERIKRCAGNKGLIKLGKRKKIKKQKGWKEIRELTVIMWQ